jgi:hypothetical protein
MGNKHTIIQIRLLYKSSKICQEFIRIKCTLLGALAKIGLTHLVDTKYETSQADIFGDLAMCASLSQNDVYMRYVL